MRTLTFYKKHVKSGEENLMKKKKNLTDLMSRQVVLKTLKEVERRKSEN